MKHCIRLQGSTVSMFLSTCTSRIMVRTPGQVNSGSWLSDQASSKKNLKKQTYHLGLNGLLPKGYVVRLLVVYFGLKIELYKCLMKKNPSMI